MQRGRGWDPEHRHEPIRGGDGRWGGGINPQSSLRQHILDRGTQHVTEACAMLTQGGKDSACGKAFENRKTMEIFRTK